MLPPSLLDEVSRLKIASKEVLEIYALKTKQTVLKTIEEEEEECSDNQNAHLVLRCTIS